MDALALLCNLYGDGPATLKRLRSAGCDSFLVLEDLESDQLAEILGTNEAAARRFLREARLLVERLDEGELEREERPPLITPAPVSSTPVSSTPVSSTPGQAPALAETATEASAPESALPEPVLPQRVSAGAPAALGSERDRSSALIDRVLATWRERDASVGAEHDVEFSERDEPVDSEELTCAETLLGTPLRPRLVDGLDRTLCESLMRAGFPTVEELADADALVVAGNSGAELTRVMRLQFLARRLISERGEVEAAEPPAQLDRVLKPAGRPWPLARASSAALPVREPQREIPTPESGAQQRRVEEREGAKFSISETPLGAGPGGLGEELDRAGQRLRRSDADPAGPDEGTGGPFA